MKEKKNITTKLALLSVLIPAVIPSQTVLALEEKINENLGIEQTQLLQNEKELKSSTITSDKQNNAVLEDDLLILKSPIEKIDVVNENNQQEFALSSNSNINPQTIFSWGGLDLKLDASGTLYIPSGSVDYPGTLRGALGENSKKVTKIVVDGPLILMGLSNMFADLNNLVEIEGMENIDTRNVTGMTGMFANCSSLVQIDVSSFDTSNVEDMSSMFLGCGSLLSLDLSSFDTTGSLAITMNSMFSGCSSLTTLDISSFDMTHSYVPTSHMFQDCMSLNKLKLGPYFSTHPTTGLPELPENIKWRNIGNGTEDAPQGDNIWSSWELMSGTYYSAKDADIYVWENQDTSQAGNVVVKYVDTEGNNISEDMVKSGNIGEDYTTEQKEIEGYTFKEVQGDTSGKFTDQAQTVTYIYIKNPEVGSDVTAKYVDTEGNKISEDVVKSGNIGEDYTTEQKEIEGYTFKEVQGDASGKFTDQSQTVTYVYTKSPVAGSDVTAKYVDTEGNKISEDVVKLGNIGEDYTTEQKEISGYTFKEVQGDASGKFTDQAQTVTYIYEQNDEAVPGEETDNSKETESSTEKQTSDTSSVSQRSDISKSGSKYLPTTGEKATIGLSFAGLSALVLAGYYYFRNKK